MFQKIFQLMIWHGYVYDFSIDCDSIGVDNILDLHKYLMKNYDIK